MGRYQIKAPDGRTVTIEGPSPPTQDDAEEIFRNLPPIAPSKTQSEMLAGRIGTPEGNDRGQELTSRFREGVSGMIGMPVQIATDQLGAISRLDPMGLVPFAPTGQRMADESANAIAQGEYVKAIPVVGPMISSAYDRFTNEPDKIKATLGLIGEGAAYSLTPKIGAKAISDVAGAAKAIKASPGVVEAGAIAKDATSALAKRLPVVRAFGPTWNAVVKGIAERKNITLGKAEEFAKKMPEAELAVEADTILRSPTGNPVMTIPSAKPRPADVIEGIRPASKTLGQAIGDQPATPAKPSKPETLGDVVGIQKLNPTSLTMAELETVLKDDMLPPKRRQFIQNELTRKRESQRASIQDWIPGADERRAMGETVPTKFPMNVERILNSHKDISSKIIAFRKEGLSHTLATEAAKGKMRIPEIHEALKKAAIDRGNK
jgi:hypothetical protein